MATRAPGVTGLMLVGLTSALRSGEVLQGSQRLLLTALALSSLILYWFGSQLISTWRFWVFLATQAGLILGIGILVPGHWLVLVLWKRSRDQNNS